MPRGEKLFRFLAPLMMQEFHGVVTIRMEAGKGTHVETETERAWQYKDLPEKASGHPDTDTEQQTVPAERD